MKNNSVGNGAVHDFSFKLQSCISDLRILHNGEEWIIFLDLVYRKIVL